MKDDFLVVWSARRVMRVRWGAGEVGFSGLLEAKGEGGGAVGDG